MSRESTPEITFNCPVYSEIWFRTATVGAILDAPLIPIQPCTVQFITRTPRTTLLDASSFFISVQRIPNSKVIETIAENTHKNPDAIGVVVKYSPLDSETWSLQRLTIVRMYDLYMKRLKGWKALLDSEWLNDRDRSSLKKLSINAQVENIASPMDFWRLGAELCTGNNTWISGTTLNAHISLRIPHLNSTHRRIIIPPADFHARLIWFHAKKKRGEGGEREHYPEHKYIRDLVLKPPNGTAVPLFAVFLHKSQVHWGSALIDISRGTVQLQDSLGWPDQGDIGILPLFSQFFGVELRMTSPLHLGRQTDGGSCGIAAASSMEYYNRTGAPLWTPSTATAYRQSCVSSIVAAHFETTVRRSIPCR